eukprot:1646720-Pyramimonas_sp.AAC.1
MCDDAAPLLCDPYNRRNGHEHRERSVLGQFITWCNHRSQFLLLCGIGPCGVVRRKTFPACGIASYT